jgi:SAM-dependent methyltransferase
MSLQRSVEPEWLDQLAAEDPRAIRHRRDLKLINAFMLQSNIMEEALSKHWLRNNPRSLLDIGCGDGTFMLRVARRLAARWPDVAVTLLDQQNIVSDATRQAFAALGWKAEPVRADAFEYLEQLPARVDILTANLVLHHFSQEQLTRLLSLAAQSTRLFAACEPRRSKFVLRISRLLWLIGCSEVARQDAVLSARAGFRGKELSTLWPTEGRWELHEDAARLFTHCFVARQVE